MNVNLQSKYFADIQTELDQIPSKRGRIVYLCDHLEVYVSRLVGFSAASSLPKESLLQSGLFIIVLVAIGLTNNVLRQFGRMPVDFPSWQEFARFAQCVDDSRRKDDDFVPMLQRKCDLACQELRAL
jgi:hypothetical protein